MKRNLQLDFLRCAAIIMVMLNHLPGVDQSIVSRAVVFVGKGGWIGVDMFFVLSGFLVSGLIMKEYERYGNFNAGRFLLRRGFKIYPAYYLFLLFILLYNHFAGYPRYLTEMLWKALFVVNYFDGVKADRHLWSVSVEEHFYFLLVILFVLLIKYKKVKLSYFVGIYVILCLTGLGFRLYNYFAYTDYNFLRDYARSHFRFDALFFGVLLAYLSNYQPKKLRALTAQRYRLPLAILALAFLLSNIMFGRENHRWMAVVNLAINPLCFGYLMLCLLEVKNALFLQIIKPFAYVGQYSYSIYLFHLFFIAMAEKLGWLGATPFYLCCFAFAITGGILISKAIEYPFLKLRDRYFPSRSGKVVG